MSQVLLRQRLRCDFIVIMTSDSAVAPLSGCKGSKGCLIRGAPCHDVTNVTTLLWAIDTGALGL